MVTFANLGSVRLPSLKFVGIRVRKIRHIQCVSCLSTTVSQLFEPQLQKIVIFTYPGLHICLPWGRPYGNHAKRCINEKTIQCLLNPSQHVPIYLEQFPSYSNRKCKNRRFHVLQPTFLFPLWRRPCDYHAICSMDEKTIQCLPNPCRPTDPQIRRTTAKQYMPTRERAIIVFNVTVIIMQSRRNSLLCVSHYQVLLANLSLMSQSRGHYCSACQTSRVAKN